ncbi:DUF3597 domain-containing protein [Roseicella frigidaeris]|uniref:DUF3597 domain-containing protein n=1 Tax=Roseicella frigidaeris TaxID=2230885 RepID=A0A327MCL3_9PROT|nr:DUF3597 domain-containing protein [Roseicella frigidaeris]RAI60387.1 DUF3597 domain-containing protein [Roseicella frigidaeris]
MSVFGNILSKIFGHSQAAAQPGSGASPSGAAPATPGAPDGAAGASGQTPSISDVDVAALLDGLAAKAPQKLDWKHSIVDLMKLLGLDSSLEARKELAQELHYDGSTSDSAAMNIWLHRQVMQKLAQNGGKVPEELRR